MNPSPFDSAADGSGRFSASAERDRKSIRDRFQDLIDSDSSAIFACDAGGVITYFNKRAADLWDSAPPMGDTHDRFCRSRLLYRVNGKYASADQNPMTVVLAGKVSGIFDGEAHVLRSDGSRVIVIVNIAPLIDDNGRIVGAVHSFRENPLR